MLHRHAYPTLGDRPLSSILPSDIQAWVKGLELAPATVGVVHGIVSTIMKAAIRDRRIVGNPWQQATEGGAQADRATDDRAGEHGP